jgi:hypothetical protein
LTAGETAKLENQQKGINQQVAADRAANGGKLTAGEKKQVNSQQNSASKNIYNKKPERFCFFARLAIRAAVAWLRSSLQDSSPRS